MNEREYAILKLYFQFEEIEWSYLRDTLTVRPSFMGWANTKADVQWEVSKINRKLKDFGLIETYPRTERINETSRITEAGKDAYKAYPDVS